MKKIKEEIKGLAENQKMLKNQRKTVNLKGERLMSPGEASWKHSLNRDKLRILYAVYGLMKGKKFSEIENKFPEENHPLNNFKRDIDKFLILYSEKKKELVGAL